MFHKEIADIKSSRNPNWNEKADVTEDPDDDSKNNQEKWYWPIDPVKILDIRQLGDDKGKNGTKGYLVDVIDSDSKSNRFNKAGENMQNLKSSLTKIGVDVRQEKVILEDDSMNDSAKQRRPKEGSKPRLWARPEAVTDKCTNVFHAKSRDAGISASWTRFCQDETAERN